MMGHELRALVDLKKEYNTNTMAINLQLQVNQYRTKGMSNILVSA